MADSATIAFIGYTVVHYVGFAVVGTVAVAIVHFSREQPSVLAGAFLAFIVSQALIYGFIALLHATDLLQHLTWVLIAVGNVIGAALIGWKLWRDHPGLGRGFDAALGGTEPQQERSS
jgi:FtsH-binding integral membrane protein